MDQCISALLDDMSASGILEETLVVVTGEFGRSPKINKNAGRDHWPRVSTAVLAGGGMNHGQVIGQTNRLGEYAVDRPVNFQEVAATLYNQIGVNLRATREFDLRGRPYSPVNAGVEPIRELL